jgi:hypothetical protein
MANRPAVQQAFKKAHTAVIKNVVKTVAASRRKKPSPQANPHQASTQAKTPPADRVDPEEVLRALLPDDDPIFRT